MTDNVMRLYAGAFALLTFFLVWAVVAARPWATSGNPDPRVTALERREQKLVRESRRVDRVVNRRFATYRRRLARRQREIRAAQAAAAQAPAAASSPTAPVPAAAPPPSVSVTAAPPVTVSGSS